MYDVIIIGSGPSGLAAALTAKECGLDYLVLERGVIANTVYQYPLTKPLFSTSNEVELKPGALPADRKPTREEVLAHYTDLVACENLKLHTGEEVKRITPMADHFIIATTEAEYRAQTVLVTVGGFGRQRRLNVPGEDPTRVSYRFVEAFPFAKRRVLVVGGGNSAAEAALFLSEVGAQVTLSVRRPELELVAEVSFNREGKPRGKIKPWVLEPLAHAQAAGRVRILTSAEITEILPRSARLRVGVAPAFEWVEVECDHIFALIGADPDTSLLEQAGVEIAPDGRPVYHQETYETSVPGIYVAGHITRELHMKNALPVARQIINHLASQRAESARI